MVFIMKKALIIASIVLSGSLMAEVRNLQWGEPQNRWNNFYEQKYSEFVHILGKARERGFCTTTQNCLINPKANPFYYQNNPANLMIRSDCADLPFVLRTYFAWMNKLPFSYPSWPVKVLPPELEKLALKIEGYDDIINNAIKKLRLDQKQRSQKKRLLDEKKDQLKDTPRRVDRDVAEQDPTAQDRLDQLRDQLKDAISKLKDEVKSLKHLVNDDEDKVKDLEKEKEDLKDELAKRSKKYSKRDIRYTPYGARIVKRINVTAKMTVNQVIDDVNNKVSTASFRSRADRYDTGKNYRDFYPIKIDRSAMKPGTVLYDPAGHIAVVYDVTKDGRIKLIDAHPDQSLTHIVYGKKFSRSSVLISGGFMNWRPVSYNHGEFVPTSNDQLPNYSLVQYTGVNERNPDLISYKDAVFYSKGEKLDFYDYVRSQLFKGRVQYDPVEELDSRTDELCEDLKARAHAVDSAIKNKISEKKQPRRLPKNIYGTSGEWEEYSTPSRDARFKALFLETQSMVKKYLKMERANDPKIKYDGDNLAWDLQKLYERKSQRCKVNVTLSTGKQRKISLAEVESKLFELSFDPYHCAELRWGITDFMKDSKKSFWNSDSEEITVSEDDSVDNEPTGWFSRHHDDEETTVKVCTDKKKLKWYKAEQKLRNQVNRDYKEEMDVTLFGLRMSKLGVKKRPYLNIKEVISQYLY